jgi:hypothetical protein
MLVGFNGETIMRVRSFAGPIVFVLAGAAAVTACGSSGNGAPAGGLDSGVPSGTEAGGGDDATAGNDGSSSSGNPGDSAVDAEVQAILAQLQAAGAGMPADVDGDGTPDYTTTHRPDGSTETQIDIDQDGNPEFDSVVDTQGNVTTTIDSNSDGVADEETTYAVGPPPTQVRFVDTDFDGLMDHRETVTYAVASGMLEVQEATSAAEDGNYAVDSDTMDSISAAQANGAGCDGQQGFPGSTGGSSAGLSGVGVSIPTDGGGGRCSSAEAQKLVDAYACAMDQGIHCLMSTNRGLALKLFSALAHQSLVVGCGNPCSGEDAATQRGIAWIPGLGAGHTNFNPNFVDSGSAADLCTVALHEALHWIGEGFEPGHDNGTDRVYGCGRYCGGCTMRGPGFVSSNVDCAACADTPDAKQACGTKQKLVSAPGTGTGLCHMGLACIAADCTDPRGIETDTCDGQPIPGQTPSFYCCATCPSTCNASNDLPCSGNPTLADSCSTPPPACP